MQYCINMHLCHRKEVLGMYEKEVKEKTSQILPKVVGWRRHFHEYPEVSGEEKETSLYIQQVLTELGIPFETGFFGTAVLGTIKGDLPGKTVALRADMDALPVTELTGLPFASKNKGVMHACGHDGHMSILLGAAAVLQSMKSQLHGTVKLVFQPAEEEASIGGGRHIAASGKLDDIEEIYGLHAWPELPVGQVGLKKGNLMAASDRFYVHVKGKSTHAAQPHNGTDALVAAAHFIIDVQTLISREMNPMENVVCTIGLMNAGTRYNVGVEDAYLEGTVRTYTPALRDKMEQRLGELLKGLDYTFGTHSELNYVRGHSATINTPEKIDFLDEVAKTYIGKEHITHPEFPSMCAEDFSYYLEKFPGAFLWLGTGKEGTPALHNASFALDESILPLGIIMEAGACLETLAKE